MKTATLRGELLLVGLLGCLVFFEVSCAGVSTAQERQDLRPSPIVQVPQRAELEKDASFVVYGGLLSMIHNNGITDDQSLFDGTRPIDLLVYQKTTVGPTAAERLDQSVEASPELMSEFRRVNETTSELDEEYEVLAPTAAFANSSRLEVSLTEAKRRYPDAKAFVAFSKVAYDEHFNEALVYFEYQKPRSPKIKMFAKISLEKYKPNTAFDEVVGFIGTTFFFVK